MKIKAACLSIVLCLALCCPAFAVDREMNVVFTPEMLATINEHNEKLIVTSRLNLPQEPCRREFFALLPLSNKMDLIAALHAPKWLLIISG